MYNPIYIIIFYLGFVDGHTHALWAGDRVSEFSMKVGRKDNN